MCCEFYYPSIGGVQVVIQKLAEKFAAGGHDVTVATTGLTAREFFELNGVRIEEFSVTGNFVSGLNGNVEAYQDFVCSGGFDIVMIKAAQQWTFDALWPVLDSIPAVKVFIPCGFSSLYEPFFANYFERLPEILKKFDQLIFYASDYRDINFAKKNGITQISIVPNGACEIEFSVDRDPLFRSNLGISEKDFVFLTVGSFTGLKGHLEVARAFAGLDMKGRSGVLILNGNRSVNFDRTVKGHMVKALGTIRTLGVRYVAKHSVKTMLSPFGISVGKEKELSQVIDSIESQQGKTVLVTDMPRPQLVQAFIEADLFVFASRIEYSPLVLFESAAAGTPFLTVPVGNAPEIARWTECGIICPASRDARGYTDVDPGELSLYMSRLMEEPELLKKLGQAGRKNWREKFTWEKISKMYESVFQNLLEKR